MAQRTFLQIYEDALQQIDALSSDERPKAVAIIKSGINESYSEAAAIRDWKELENNTTASTVAGTEEYTPVTSTSATPRIRRIEAVKDETNAVYLQPVKREEFEQSYPFVNTTSDRGRPTVWYQSGFDASRDVKIKVYKVPDAAYTLRIIYYEEPSELSADTDQPRIPDQWHYGLYYKALSKWFEFKENVQLAQYYRGLHEDWKAKMTRAEYDQSTETPEFRTESPKRSWIVGKVGRIYN